MAPVQTVTQPCSDQSPQHAAPRVAPLHRTHETLERRARTAWQFARTVLWPALLVAGRATLQALRTAWRTRGQWRPALLLAGRTTLAGLRTALHGLRTAWRTRAQWWPVLLLGGRTWLREFWTACRQRVTASPALLLLLAVLVAASWVTRATGLAAPHIAPAAHTAPAAAAPASAAPQAAPAPEAPPAPAPPPNAPACLVSTPAPPPPPAGLTPEQIANAQVIAQVAEDRGLPERAVVIALATAQQESKLVNIDYGDRDSLGLFQQRPSMGWGTPQQLLDPAYAAGKFYDALVQVPGWDSDRLTDAAQAVQRSGFPDLYQQWEGLATALATSVTPAAPAQPACP